MPRILVVDDNAEMRSALKRILEAQGYEVDLAQDGAQAAALQAKRRADVLVTDLFMPERDGIETIELFRARYPAMGIIAMSGDPHLRVINDYLEVAKIAGANLTLRKPFAAEALLQALRDLSAV
jgi:CheY-like chemotaxis protein